MGDRGAKPSVPPTAHQSAALYRADIFSWGASLARILPLALTRALAGFAGKIYAWMHPARVAGVHRNLQLLDASLSEKNARSLYGEFGKTMADYFYIATRSPQETVKIITRRTGYENLETLHKQGTGALIVTAHFGLFELGGLLMAQSGFSAAVLTLPEPSGSLTAWRAEARRKWGVDTIEVGPDPFVFVQIAKRLREGGFIAALIDRPAATESTSVTFPNGTAYFSSGILLIAAQCGVPIVPTTMARQTDGSYHAEVFAPIYVEPRETRAETLRFYSQKIADTLMPTLCAFPEQWYQFVPLA